MLVIDCSVIGAWLLPDENTPFTVEALVEASDVIVPSLFYTEVLNVLTTAYRRKRIDAQTKEAALRQLMRLPVTIDEPSYHKNVLPHISALAEKHTLSAYDAAYLEVAIRRRTQLMTSDKSLYKAAQAEGVAYSVT